MSQKNVLITGSTDGIGLQTAKELINKGYHVIIHARSEKRGKVVIEKLKQELTKPSLSLAIGDLDSLDQVRKMAQRLIDNYTSLSVLINNAGIFERELKLSPEGYELTFVVNYLSHFLLTRLLIPLLLKGRPSRIINVSSMAHSRSRLNLSQVVNPVKYDGYEAYSHSKLCNILFTYELVRQLVNKGYNEIIVNCLHPGVISTKLLHKGWSGGASVSVGARTSVYLASASEVTDITGKYFVDCKVSHSSTESYDENKQKELWKFSSRLVGLPESL